MFVPDKANGEQPINLVADLLNKAANILETGGWCAGMLVRPDGHHCIRGAFMKAVGIADADMVLFKYYGIFNEEQGYKPEQLDLMHRAEEAVRNYLCLRIVRSQTNGISDIVGIWNNKQTSGEPVIAACRETALYLMTTNT